MVLDDASPQVDSTPAKNGSGTTQSLKPPGSIPPGTVTMKLKPELVVQPDLLTLYFGFWGKRNWKDAVATEITGRVDSVWLLANRSITQEEMDAFTVHSSRKTYYDRIGLPVGGFLATLVFHKQVSQTPWYHQVRGAASPIEMMRFAQTFYAADKVAFRQAVVSCGFKGLFIMSIASLLGHGLGFYSQTKGMLTDPRLKTFFRDISDSTPEEIRKRKLQRVGERVQRLRGEKELVTVQFPDDSNDGGAYASNDQGPNSYGASPTSDSPQYDTSYNTNQSEQYNGNGSVEQQRSVASVSRRPQPHDTAEQQTPASQPSSGADFFSGTVNDDASPTAAEYRNTNADDAPAGSSWARLRQQNASGPQARAQWGRSQPPAPAESYYAGPGDQDRYSYEKTRDKEQAQADFDRMMDAERSASTDESPKNKGWWS